MKQTESWASARRGRTHSSWRALAIIGTLLASTWMACGEENAPKGKGVDEDAFTPNDATPDDATQAEEADSAALKSETAGHDGGTPDAGPMSPRFTFAIIADPHITGKSTALQRLKKAVGWINAQAQKRDIELVLVLGDIGWGKKNGLALAKGALDTLSMPYVPALGDNEIHGGSEKQYDQIFGPHLKKLKGTFADFVYPPSAVTMPNGETMWQQNVAFSFKGLRFINPDFSPRDDGPITGEQGELHDFPGGAWPWLTTQLGALGERPQESVILYTHIPMHLSPGGLSDVEMEKVYTLIGPLAPLIYADFCGHYHFDMTDDNPKAGYITYVTDATWDDHLRVRLVTVSGNGAAFTYKHELIDVPWP